MLSPTLVRRLLASCDACREHVPDNAVPWDLEASGCVWRFCSLACMAKWAREQLAARELVDVDEHDHAA
jgi:hypothetical protein